MWIAVSKAVAKTWRMQWIISQWNVELYAVWCTFIETNINGKIDLDWALCRMWVIGISDITDLSLRLNRRSRTLQDWTFTQQCVKIQAFGTRHYVGGYFPWLLDHWRWRHSSIKISGTTHQMTASHHRKLDFPSESVSIIIWYRSRKQTGPTHTLFHCFCIHRSMYLLFSPPHSMPDIHKEILWS
jgi:hypothetical protein